jgi:Cu/Ag efflux protein CusF
MRVLAGSHPALVDGGVTKVDASPRKITIKHGPVRKFDMDGMTMVFRANDPSMLQDGQAGRQDQKLTSTRSPVHRDQDREGQVAAGRSLA